MSITELRMLRWSSGMTRRNKLKNEYIRGSIGVVPIVNKIRGENRSRWLGHVSQAVKVAKEMEVDGRKGRVL